MLSLRVITSGTYSTLKKGFDSAGILPPSKGQEKSDIDPVGPYPPRG